MKNYCHWCGQKLTIKHPCSLSHIELLLRYLQQKRRRERDRSHARREP